MINQQIDQRKNKSQKGAIATNKLIANLNDNLRRYWYSPAHGTTVLTAGVQALVNSEPLINCLMQAIADFNGFTEDNDPYQEHDFGCITFWNQKILWKIDYYNLAMTEHSPCAADPYMTKRVLTVMLAEEY